MHAERMAYCGPRALALDEFLRWPESSQRAALDWQSYEARRCRSCGIHPDDIAEKAFHAHLDQCKGCQARERVSEAPGAREGRGIYAVALPVSARNCPQCLSVLGAARD